MHQTKTLKFARPVKLRHSISYTNLTNFKTTIKSEKKKSRLSHLFSAETRILYDFLLHFFDRPGGAYNCTYGLNHIGVNTKRNRRKNARAEGRGEGRRGPSLFFFFFPDTVKPIRYERTKTLFDSTDCDTGVFSIRTV